MTFGAELLFAAAAGEIFISLGERSVLTRWALWVGFLLVAARLLFVRFEGRGVDGRTVAAIVASTGLLLSLLFPLTTEVAVLSTAVLFVVTRWKVQFRGTPALLPVYWVLLLLAFLSERDAQLHMQLMGETRYDGFVVPLLVGAAVLAMLSLDTVRSLRESLRRICAPYSICVAFSALGIGYLAFNLPLTPTLSELSDTHLVVLILLWGTVCSSAVTEKYGKAPAQRWGWAMFLCLGVFGVRGLFLMNGESRCNRDPARYAVNSSLIVHLLAAEDPLFLVHAGIDFYRLRRALYETLTHGRYGRGGSTLSMQLAKVCFLPYEKELVRKLDQVGIAVLLELTHSKATLLYSYLESVPFAPDTVGLRAATTLFYGSNPEALTEDQELALVQTIFNPSEFNPNAKVIPRHVRLRTAVIKGLGKRLCPRILGDLSSIDDIKALPKKCT